ncbi:zinc ribbon domain-containing protein [Metabacillus niabensis]|uniref:Zinc ribbon domain-containing protein n=1 Tax=Metabacillus niabensis TaxID=324854 RepID=A0ABT9YV56_9BACI|nr:zinc ribbon domain-containing protein [Metabacillus niabensis]MDQ0223872.1 hypothetical protein [Metabacillus niabensis]
MICSNCGHQNEGGKFCVKCGTKLVGETAEQQQAATVEPTIPVSNQPVQPEQAETTFSAQPTRPEQPVQPAEPNKHVEAAKNVSKLFFSYFIDGLKNPTKAAQSVGQEQFVNGLITMILYALFIPLTIYFGLKVVIANLLEKIAGIFPDEFDFFDVTQMISFYEQPGFSSVLKPIFYSLIIIAIIVLLTFVVIKLGRVQLNIKELIARFGAFSIVPTALLLVALILSIIKVDIFLYVWFFGLLGLLFVVPFTIYSFKKDVPFGLDGIYGTIIMFIVILIITSFVLNNFTDSLVSGDIDLTKLFNDFDF